MESLGRTFARWLSHSAKAFFGDSAVERARSRAFDDIHYRRFFLQTQNDLLF